MKYCPVCERRYDDEMRMCGVDGTPLRSQSLQTPVRDQPARDQMLGRVVKGRYQIMRRLGEGGMGTVYLAEQVSIGRKVALKLLRGSYAMDDEFIERFRREARLAASLNHRNIVTVYDFDQGDDESLFIAMEYLDGEKLSDVIRREGPLDMGRAVRFGLQFAEGLEAAHHAGVIHRDIKPDNIMVVGEEGVETIKLMDFGIARLRDVAATSRLTRPDVIMGTPAYMAPEQAEGKETSERTDIYALGVVLYEMLSGEVPFKANTPAAVLLKQIQESPVPLRKLRREVPAEIERIVMQALEKKPEKRQRDMRDLVQGLRKAGKTIVEYEYDVPETIMTTIPMKGDVALRRKRFSRNIIWASLAVILVILGGIIAAPRFTDLIGGFTELVGEWYDPKDKLSNSGSLEARVEPPAPNPVKPDLPSTDLSSIPAADDRSEVNRQFQEHIKVARFFRERGDYADAIAELGKARSADPANGQVDLELERVLKACKAEMEILKRTDLNC
jgi:serine/threonine protein kinase